MKKLLSVLLAAMLVMSLCVTSFAAPTIDYVFKSETDYYLFGSTDSVVDDLGVEISSANVKAQTITFSEDGTPELLNTLNDVKKFGFKIGNPEDVIGNTIGFKPYQVVNEATTYGDYKFARGVAENAAVTPEKPGTYLASNVVTATPNTSYSIKEATIRFDSKKTVAENMGGAFYAQGYRAGSSYFSANRLFLIQVPLTEEMLTATNIYLSVGANNTYSSGHTTLTANGAEFSVWEATNLNNNWSYTATETSFSEMINSGDTIEKSLISTYKVTDDGVYTSSATTNLNYKDGYILKLGGADFTSFIKNKINAGEKFVNLIFGISDLSPSMGNSSQSLMVFGTSRIHLNGNYSGGRDYLEKYLSAIRWE